MRLIALLALLLLAACEVATISAPARSPVTPEAARALQRFEVVVARVVPVAEEECRIRRRGAICNFRVLVDTDPRLGRSAALEPSVVGHAARLIEEHLDFDRVETAGQQVDPDEAVVDLHRQALVRLCLELLQQRDATQAGVQGQGHPGDRHHLVVHCIGRRRTGWRELTAEGRRRSPCRQR